jgi:hypothetical protein
MTEENIFSDSQDKFVFSVELFVHANMSVFLFTHFCFQIEIFFYQIQLKY